MSHLEARTRCAQQTRQDFSDTIYVEKYLGRDLAIGISEIQFHMIVKIRFYIALESLN